MKSQMDNVICYKRKESEINSAITLVLHSANCDLSGAYKALKFLYGELATVEFLINNSATEQEGMNNDSL